MRLKGERKWKRIGKQKSAFFAPSSALLRSHFDAIFTSTKKQTYALATLLSGGSPRAEAVCVSRRWRTIESSSSPRTVPATTSGIDAMFFVVSFFLSCVFWRVLCWQRAREKGADCTGGGLRAREKKSECERKVKLRRVLI